VTVQADDAANLHIIAEAGKLGLVFEVLVLIRKPFALAPAIKAKSVNVSSTTTGKQREMTEDEILSAAYRRAASR